MKKVYCPCKNCLVFSICNSSYVKITGLGKPKVKAVDVIDLYRNCDLFCKWWVEDQNWNEIPSRQKLVDTFGVTYIYE